MMRSSIHVSTQRFDINIFPSFFGTYPTHEETSITVNRIGDLIAPAGGPMIVADKAKALFFLPCGLKAAPLVGKTLERAIRDGLPVIGKMRSSSHVTSGAWAKLDGDGLSEDQLASAKAKLKLAGIAYLIYSTHSHGRADKPGIRCRIIVFFDKALEPLAYQRAVLSLSLWLFGKSLDESEARLSQQAGVWCAHPERIEQAFCIRQLDGVCVSTSALLAAAPAKTNNSPNIRISSSTGPLPLDAHRVRAALLWIDPNNFVSWVNCGVFLKVAFGDAAYSLWLEWSELADQEAQAQNDGRYAPDKVWSGLTPRYEAELGARNLFSKAKDNAIMVTREAAANNVWNQRARDALVYLRLFHAELYANLFKASA